MAKLKVWSTLLLWQLVGFCTTRGNPAGPPKSTGKVHNIQIAKVGQTRKLACPVEAEPPPLMQWLKDSEIIHQGWTRFRVSQDGTLRIKTVEMDDAGRYICKATNGFGTISINYTVVVVDDEARTFRKDKGILPQTPDEDLKKEDAVPQFSQPQKMKRQNIVRPVGSSVRLKCRAQGNPRPHVEWQKDGETLEDYTFEQLKGKHSWTLKLHDLQEDDSGKYTCVVSNRLGWINYTYVLEVIEKVKSKPELLAPHPLNTTVEYGGSASFQCRVKSIVEPHIQWLKRVDDPSALPNPNATIDVKGQKFIVLKAGKVWKNRPDGSYLNKLLISRANEGDAGMYICLGANSMGYNFRSAFLLVAPGPKADQAASSRSVSTANTSLSLIIAVPSCVIIVVVIVAVIILKRQRRCRRNNSSGVTLRTPRFNPVPTQEKDIYPAVQNPHMFQTSRDKISKNHSIDFYSDISSVSRSHHQNQQMPQYGY